MKNDVHKIHFTVTAYNHVSWCKADRNPDTITTSNKLESTIARDRNNVVDAFWLSILPNVQNAIVFPMRPRIQVIRVSKAIITGQYIAHSI